MASEPRRPRDEVAVALAGPAVSLLLGGAFLALVVPTAGTNLQGAAWWLTRVNFSLAVFNLLPGFPLDGGRVLRGVVWGLTGSLNRATRIAATGGTLIASALIAAGILIGAGGNWGSGLWLAFIGWFLLGAARMSLRQADVTGLLRGRRVAQVMMTDCPRIPPDLTLRQLVDDYILPTGRRCFPVVRDGEVTGVVALEHVRRIPKSVWQTWRVGQVMIPLARLATVGPGDSLERALERLGGEDGQRLAVIEDGRFVGLVGRDSILRFVALLTQLSPAEARS